MGREMKPGKLADICAYLGMKLPDLAIISGVSTATWRKWADDPMSVSSTSCKIIFEALRILDENEIRFEKNAEGTVAVKHRGNTIAGEDPIILAVALVHAYESYALPQRYKLFDFPDRHLIEIAYGASYPTMKEACVKR